MSLDIFEKHLTDNQFVKLSGKTQEEQISFCINFLKQKGYNLAKLDEPNHQNTSVAGKILTATNTSQFTYGDFNSHMLETGFIVDVDKMSMFGDGYIENCYNNMLFSITEQILKKDILYGSVEYNCGTDNYIIKSQISISPYKKYQDTIKISEILSNLKQKHKNGIRSKPVSYLGEHFYGQVSS